MKSAVFYGKHDIRVEEHELPKVGPKDVLIQVKACGVCGTDVHIYNGDPGAADVTPPTILGHEFSGVVTEIGSEVKSIKVGDRVCIDPNCYDASCTPCRDGVAHYCKHMIGYGTTTNGGFAQYAAVNERQVYKLGEHTTFEMGAMTEPVSCCVHGIDMCNIKVGDQVVVIGGGMIGLLMLQLAKLSGASKLAMLEPVASKRELALKLGADVAIDPLKEDVKARLEEEGFFWINCVIECAGLPSTMSQAIDLAGPKATVMLFGLTSPEQEISVKPFQVFKKELVITASFINPYTQRRALSLIDSKKIDVSSMVYEVAPLEKLSDILSKPELRALGKYIISPEK